MNRHGLTNIRLKEISRNELALFQESFKDTYLSDRFDLFKKYLKEHSEKNRYVLLACSGGKMIGYVTLKYVSDYENFAQNNIPEIVDFNVVPRFRKRGIGRKLLKRIESVAKKSGYAQIGIGVGLSEDYGAAQRLYVKMNYIPDATGLHYDAKPVQKGTTVRVDDSLAVYLIKNL